MFVKAKREKIKFTRKWFEKIMMKGRIANKRRKTKEKKKAKFQGDTKKKMEPLRIDN